MSVVAEKLETLKNTARDYKDSSEPGLFRQNVLLIAAIEYVDAVREEERVVARVAEYRADAKEIQTLAVLEPSVDVSPRSTDPTIGIGARFLTNVWLVAIVRDFNASSVTFALHPPGELMLDPNTMNITWHYFAALLADGAWKKL